jgi:hypothetical protein
MQDSSFSEEKIFIRAYPTSEAIKNEMRQRIVHHLDMGWHLDQILDEGAFLRLTFRKNF